MLTNITHNGPVEVRQLGTAGQGLVWTVQPENFKSVIAMINANGGPGAWKITAI